MVKKAAWSKDLKGGREQASFTGSDRCKGPEAAKAGAQMGFRTGTILRSLGKTPPLAFHSTRKRERRGMRRTSRR